MSLLLIAETQENKLLPITSRLVRAARQLCDDIHMLVIDAEAGTANAAAAELDGVGRVLHLAHDAPDRLPLDSLGAQIVPLMQGYDGLIGADLGRGRHLVPLVAARLGLTPLTGVSAILGAGVFERPIHAGALLEQVDYTPAKPMLTIRAAGFDNSAAQAPCPIEPLVFTGEYRSGMDIIEVEAPRSGRPELETASIVVAGGRGFGCKENFAQLEQLADQLQAALGASRVAVDMGWAPHGLQIGQTGRKIAPDLYIAMGISGAVQHMAGIKDARVVVCINTDEEAPMFSQSNYGLVGDINLLMPRLLQLFEKLKA